MQAYDGVLIAQVTPTTSIIFKQHDIISNVIRLNFNLPGILPHLSAKTFMYTLRALD